MSTTYAMGLAPPFMQERRGVTGQYYEQGGGVRLRYHELPWSDRPGGWSKNNNLS